MRTGWKSPGKSAEDGAAGTPAPHRGAGREYHLGTGGRVLKFQRAPVCNGLRPRPEPRVRAVLSINGLPACTGANPSGRTRTGVPAVQGQGTLQSPRIVAVDPRVIPLKSMLYIEGFGFARAEDTGAPSSEPD